MIIELRDLTWREARHYADLGFRVRRLGWPVATVLGLAETRWLVRPRNGNRRGALFYTQLQREDGTRTAYVARNTNMREADYLADDWIAEVEDGVVPPPDPPPDQPDPPQPPQPPDPPANCDVACQPDPRFRNGGGGDAHFFINGGAFFPGGDFFAQVAWDDNVNDSAEILYVGADAGEDSTAGYIEVSYSQSPFSAVTGGMVTTRVRVIVGQVTALGLWPCDEHLFVANDQGFWHRDHTGNISYMSEPWAETIPVPTSDGSDAGAFTIQVAPHAFNGNFLDWYATPVSACRIPRIYGGLGAMFDRIRTDWRTIQVRGEVLENVTGPGTDGWSIMLDPLTRASLAVTVPTPSAQTPRTVPYAGTKYPMTPEAWLQVCNNIANFPFRAVRFPWDPSWPPRASWWNPSGPSGGHWEV